MIIDSHCHLNMKDFTGDLPVIIKNAKNSNISGMLTISTKIEEFKYVSKIAENNKESASALLQIAQKVLDSAASKKVIHKNAAARTKSRLVKAVKAIS